MSQYNKNFSYKLTYIPLFYKHCLKNMCCVLTLYYNLGNHSLLVSASEFEHFSNVKQYQ